MTGKSMDVFSLRDAVVGEYKKFATSFTTIYADDIRHVLGIDAEARVRAVAPGHRRYVAWHRAKLFRDARTP